MVNVGMVGLGRWAEVVARAAARSDRLKIVAGFSRSAERREDFARALGVPAAPDLAAMLTDPAIAGVIVTAPNEEHLAIARAAARAGKHVYIEKPVASTLAEGLAIAALEAAHGITVTVGHCARLLPGMRAMRAAIDAGELGRVAFIEANFSTPRALGLTPQSWRWYAAKAPGGPLSQLAIHQFDVLHYLGGEILAATAVAGKLSPAGAEVDDQSMTLTNFADGKVGYVGACWTSPGVFSVRVFGAKAVMHYELDVALWETPERLHEGATLYLQRSGYAAREARAVPEGDMVRAELELFAQSCRSGRPNALTAENGNVAVALVEAALMSAGEGRSVRLAEVFSLARERLADMTAERA